MASASVPPPPEDDSLLDPLLFSQLGTQQDVHSRFEEGHFGGFGPRQQHNDQYYGGDTHLKQSSYFNKTKPHIQTAHYVESQPSSSSWSGDGFVGSLDGSSSELPQRVPFTPSLQRSRESHHSRQLMTVERRLDFSFDAPEEPSGRGHVALRPVTEIPEKYRSVFKEFPFFNMVQSKVFDDVLYTDLPLVLSAPTGSGKTVVFELAIVRLLQQTGQQISSVKIVYVAPMKALCSERFSDWQAKFGPLGLRCCELTGDSQLDDYYELQSAQIVMTTPEKWDSMTRRWRDHKSLVQLVRLFLIDEVHQLNDEVRGPTVEAIVSRMKTIRAAADHCGREGGGMRGGATSLRLIAVSATIPNISDLCSWLGSEDNPALEYKIDECHRPVRLRKVVLSYPSSTSDFKFNLSLNYRLSSVVHTYSDQKPCLVFCATRKGTQQAAATLVKDARFIMSSEHKKRLNASSTVLRDSKLRDLVVCGVGYHHAGMDISDRKTIETMFTAGDLPVLFSTSTLAMGVNLPAHLVVIKSTSHYVQGMFKEYTESQVLQMIGRAGRPQFDTTATAVIMTSHANKSKYEALLGGKQLIESCLHHNLIEHLNAEIVLHTITDVSIALEWLHSTFFYIRVRQNPKFYNFPEQKDKLEGKLQELLVKDLNLLAKHSLISMEDGFLLQPTERGRLMARYCVAFKSMQQFLGLHGREELEQLVGVVSQCQEFSDVHLRVTEKRVLNTLNKDKNRATIRFPMEGKIKSKDMKVNCLLQAALGSLPVQEFSLNQDTQKIFRSASRLSKCLLELKMLGAGFKALLNSILIHKCIQARLWENSKHVARQLDKIGVTISTTLVNARLTTFDKIHDTNPRELELIVNRHPPFGTQIRDAVARLPKYAISLQQCGARASQQADLVVMVSLTNHTLLSGAGPGGGGPTLGPSHTSILLVGDSSDTTLCKQRIRDSQLLGTGQFSRKLTVHRVPESDELHVHYISMEYVGLDVHEVFSPRYTGPAPLKRDTAGHSFQTRNVSGVSGGDERRRGSQTEQGRRPCNHRCINKDVCGHDCCRNGLVVKKSQRSKTNSVSSTPTSNKPHPLPAPDSTPSSTKRKRESAMTSFIEDLHVRRNSLPPTPALKRIRPVLSTDYHTPSPPPSSSSSLSQQFSYTTVDRMRTSTNQRDEGEGSCYTGGSRLVDQIYEGREESRGGRERVFQSARRAAQHQRGHPLPIQQQGRSLPRESQQGQDSSLPRREIWQQGNTDSEMADFEDYIWDKWEDEIVTQSHPNDSGADSRNTSQFPERSIRSSNPSHPPSSSIPLPPTGAYRYSTIPPQTAVSRPTQVRIPPPAVVSRPVASGQVVQTVPVRPQPHSLPPRHQTATSSFFTAGPVDAHEDDGSDLFGSVFAGIF